MTSTDAPSFNIGVLGCGQIAQAGHFVACRKAKTAQLYAICDSAEDLLDRMVAIHQPTVGYTAYDKMLADDAVDAVVVAVADQFHVPLALRALEAGKHVLVEKPMATTIEDAEDLLAAGERAQRVVLVGHEKRYDPGVAYARDFIHERIGELIGLKHWYCDSTYRYSMTDTLQPVIESSAAARRPAGNPKADRQRYLVLGHGSHLLDTARYLGGAIRAIRARLSTKADTLAWFLEVDFENGCLGQLDLTVAVRMDWWEGFQVYGSEGSVVGQLYNPWYLQGRRSPRVLHPRRPVPPAHRRRRRRVPAAGRGPRGSRHHRPAVARRHRHGRGRRRTRHGRSCPFGRVRRLGPSRRRVRGVVMQLGIFAKTYNRPTVEQTLRAVRNDGLSAVQFNMSVLGLPTIPDPVAPQAIAEIALAADATRVTLAAISGTFNAAHPDPDTRAAYLDRFPHLARAPPRSRSRSSP